MSTTDDDASNQPLVSRKEALATGQTLYFTGKPCKRGHLSNRRVGNGYCITCEQAAITEWRAANGARMVKTRKSYYDRNRKKRIEDSIAWSKANPDKVSANRKKHQASEIYKEYRAIRLPYYLAKSRSRRSMIKASGGLFTPSDVADIKRMQKSKCAMCKCSIKNGHHIDHIMPLALGGSNLRNNLQLLCPPCNLSKNAKHPIDFAQSRGLLL